MTTKARARLEPPTAADLLRVERAQVKLKAARLEYVAMIRMCAKRGWALAYVSARRRSEPGARLSDRRSKPRTGRKK